MPDPVDYYDEAYYTRRLSKAWRADSDSIAAAVYHEFDPRRVIDFGCAVAVELSWLFEHGVGVIGVDVHPAAIDHAVIPDECMVRHDLKEPYVALKDFDVAMCLEVAEHLPESAAETLVGSCVGAANTVVFTAATPEAGGGTHHVNEQPREYWIERFERQGYGYDETAAEALRERMTVVKKTWIPERLFVFDAYA